jgi:hypothetical protein
LEKKTKKTKNNIILYDTVSNQIISQHTVDGRIIQTLMHTATPRTPTINVIFLFGSFLRMDEINQTPRAGTALRNHNIEIRGRSGVAYNSWIGV